MQEVQKSMLQSIQGVQKSMHDMMQRQDRGSHKGQRMNRGGTNKRTLQCFYCKEDGHMKKDCPALKKSGSIVPEKGTSSKDLNED